ncbi:MAG: type IV pili methyl-accepting chemotaxis transducer N-terminal domain-containing protein [Opitutaceae bacterium]|nr:type IV pili methyl-accepting chemotaxis transducer N-terminal domain-containing protein [Cytophagales bacterium]
MNKPFIAFTNKSPSAQLTILYVVALSAIAILTIFGQILVQSAINNQQHDSKIVNLSGRQRFQSQAIVKILLILSDTSQHLSGPRKSYYQTRLDQFLTNWYKYHLGIKSGNLPQHNYQTKNSKSIDSLFTVIEPHFKTVYSGAIKMKNLLKSDSIQFALPAISALKDSVLMHEFLFLDLMDQIVYNFDQEATVKVAEMRQFEMIIMFITLFVLMLEGIFIFRPAVMHIDKNIHQLIDSENNVKLVNNQLLTMNNKLETAQVELMKAEEEKYTQKLNEQKIRSASLIEGQDSERRRISLELHDGIGQMLTALKLAMDNLSLSKGLPEKEAQQAKEIKNLVTEVLTEVKGISFNLMPSVLNDFGIVSALSMLAEKAGINSGAHVVFTHNFDTKKRLEKRVEVGLYRIAQEAMNNAVKYSEASIININLNSSFDHLALNISDNGKGFNIRKLNEKIREEKKFSIGLNSMEERTNLLKGEFRIVSSVGKGTKIYVKLSGKN